MILLHELCASNDTRVQAIWKTGNMWDKLIDTVSCSNTLKTIVEKMYYVVDKQFNVFWVGSAQSFKKYEYIVFNGQFYICGHKIKPATPNFTKEDVLLCNDSLIKIKFHEEYKVWNDFSIFYENKVYDFTEYRVLNDSISICNSTDKYVQESWKLRNGWVKNKGHFFSCKRRPSKIATYQKTAFTVLKDLNVRLSLTKQVILNSEYGVFEGKVQICVEKLIEHLYVGHIKLIMIAPFCALALSIICLLLLFIVYSMLPELRTLPALNLMSLSFAFFLFLTSVAFVVLLHVRVGELFEIPCARLEIAGRFTMNCIFTNAAVNIYHLRKTFCRDTLVKSDENKWKTFLKYSLFSWGVPVVLATIYILLVSKDVLKFYQTATEPFCVDTLDIPVWLAFIEKFGLPCCLLFYNIIMFIFTGYRIRQKLRASRSIAEKSNIVRKRQSFVLLLKLSTTTAISWFPLLIEKVAFNFSVKVAVLTLMMVSGVYVGTAFVFTKKNYQLFKKKCFPAKKEAGK